MSLEVCVETLEQAEQAIQSGAGRIELCSVLSVGGVTPSISLIRAVRRWQPTPLVVLIRPRAGDFVFSAREEAFMIDDARAAIDEGADFVAVGALDHSGRMRRDWLESLCGVIPAQQLVFHRAFDETVAASEAVETLVDFGFARVLTNGGNFGLPNFANPSATASNSDRRRIAVEPGDAAEDRIDQLRALVEFAGGRIEVLPAGGIHGHNAKKILDQTGANQLHGSFRQKQIATLGRWAQDAPNPLDRQAIASVSELFR
jgi:copper homeostasis protein